MNVDLEKLYQLLPAIYRVKDSELVDNHQDLPPLKALFSILSEELDMIEENLDQLYDDQFIETCSEWAIPYIGDLIGFQPLAPIHDPKFTSRSEVANTIGYRRRKGTLSILEQLARDVTNWDANVVEYFRLLATTQYLNHLRPNNISVPNLKNWEQLEYVNSPFDTIPRTADLRNINSKRGKYNIPNIGIFLWRIQAFSRTDASAFQVDGARYTFHPLGIDTALYNFPETETSVTELAAPNHTPVAFKRRLLKEHLNAHYGRGKDIFIRIGSNRDIHKNEICIGNLSNWDDATLSPPANRVVIDPELGRIMFGADFITALSSNHVNVWYNYGSLEKMGGGEYDRASGFSDFEIIYTVSKDVGLGNFLNIQDAINEAQAQPNNAIIEVLDNHSYEENLQIQLQTGQTIELRSADGMCAVLKFLTDFTIEGEALSEVIINGFIMDGNNMVIQNNTNLERLSITHCTYLPKASSNKIILGSPIQLKINNAIVAGINTFENASIHIENSIVDVLNKEEKAISALEGQRAILQVKNTTILGEVDVKSISLVENCIFISLVTVQLLQTGCIRYSYLPFNSITPRKYHCYPKTSEEIKTVVPDFMSTIYGNPAYFQLNVWCKNEFLKGADDASEIGVYHNLFQPQKESNLQIRIQEYLRFGMEAGVFYAS
ncbi:hypothetical protein EV196_11142 [Mariniflexile fucanivorans]|uniref:Tail protein P2 I n=1 Tax=Mariniflexile fucanivorans TaxID=264023 RepID=A0A4R1RAV0_9FLAO|nr:hypothetical protein [Mariniflexile fucanivorans]TCL62846.1 hypothetical protein EV196_11142 [Mariniflexile fucanivorans]